MPALVPCPSCARHVRAIEKACPFCASTLPSDLESRAIPAANRRLNRFATFTFATTLVVGAAAACSNSGDDNTCCPPYGAPPQDGSVQDDGGAQPLYGLADATVIEDTGSPDDAGITDSGEDGD